MKKEVLRVGVGRTPVGTQLDFNVMANPFSIRKMSEKGAIKLIKENGFKFRRTKEYGKTVVVTPVGGDTYDFIEQLRENRIYLENGGIGIKND